MHPRLTSMKLGRAMLTGEEAREVFAAIQERAGTLKVRYEAP